MHVVVRTRSATKCALQPGKSRTMPHQHSEKTCANAARTAVVEMLRCSAQSGSFACACIYARASASRARRSKVGQAYLERKSSPRANQSQTHCTNVLEKSPNII